jgi:hypothetical protein
MRASVIDLQTEQTERKQASKCRILAFDREDARQFVAKLRGAFKTLRIAASACSVGVSAVEHHVLVRRRRAGVVQSGPSAPHRSQSESAFKLILSVKRMGEPAVDPYARVDQAKSSRRRFLFTDSDLDAFTVVLRSAWPRLRITTFHAPDKLRLRDDVWLEDVEAWLNPYPDLGSLVPTPEDKTLIMWDEPADWRPDWRAYRIWGPDGKTPETRFRVANYPSPLAVCQFESHRPHEEPGPHEGVFWSVWGASNAEQTRRIGKFWRLLTRFATNRIDWVFDDTGSIKITSHAQSIWIGPGALEWCRADPVRRTVRIGRPADSPAAPLPREMWQAWNCERPEQAPDFGQWQRSQGAPAARAREKDRARRPNK